ncbi:MAG TPA: GAF domain-containing protein [Terriglobales bacterium]|nr:GAF domain-containing protein [Terriglobales bacterium]
MHESSQPEDLFPSANAEDTGSAGTDRSSTDQSSTDQSSATGAVGSVGVVADNSNGSRTLAETELDSALQLLVERAQYITGATGTALALPRGEEMVCRASTGPSAPAVGARLQVRSGLTGESIARRQLLRCNNAETDPRVNLEACRDLGIASIVVLPLVRSTGEVRGLFELFSDHPYAFEERDLVALERMAELSLTALDLAEQRQKSAPAPAPRQEPEKAAAEPLSELLPEPLPESLPGLSTASSAPEASTNPLSIPVNIPLNPELAEPTVPPADAPGIPSTAPAAVPETMLLSQKCASCGFPISEGRTRCLDCETKEREKQEREQERGASADSAAPGQEEFVPAFLANSVPTRESWLANPINLMAIVVLILGILVAIVVFR